MKGPLRGMLLTLALAGSLAGCGGDVTPTAVLAAPTASAPLAIAPTTTTVAELPPTEPPRPTRITRPHTPTAGPAAPTTTAILPASVPPPTPTAPPTVAVAAPASGDLSQPTTAATQAAVAGPALPPEVAGWPKYSGPWFDIQYPPGFKAREGGQADSAFFASPDGAVEFYVFSPQWNGEIGEIEVNPQTEQIVEDVRQTGPALDDPKAIQKHWVTIRANDGSYTRAYYDEQNTLLNTRYAFGIKYRTQADYTRYRPQYLRFKQTLVQYAD